MQAADVVLHFCYAFQHLWHLMNCWYKYNKIIVTIIITTTTTTLLCNEKVLIPTKMYIIWNKIG